MPNITSLSISDAVAAQLFYDGMEQFFCTADSCTQTVNDTVPSAWMCQNLKCSCIAGATFCGGVPSKDLTNTINKLDGGLTIVCYANSTCSFGQALINSFFGQSGLTLTPCSFGECVRQSIIDGTSNSTTTPATTNGSHSLDTGVIVGLAVVGGLIGIALFLLLLGWISQRKARKVTSNPLGKRGGYPLEWSDISYTIPREGAGLRLFQRNSKDGQVTDDKVILDSVSGRVRPGQMMAILGPSGKCRWAAPTNIGPDGHPIT